MNITLGIIIVWFAVWLYKQFPRKGIKEQFKKQLSAMKWGYAKLEAEAFIAADKREELRKELLV